MKAVVHSKIGLVSRSPNGKGLGVYILFLKSLSISCDDRRDVTSRDDCLCQEA